VVLAVGEAGEEDHAAHQEQGHLGKALKRGPLSGMHSSS
jgi:hypothetical protein